jgi:hypothetical protein
VGVGIDMEVGVLRGMTVEVVEEEVMATLNLHPHQRRAPTVIPIGSTNSSLSVLGGVYVDESWGCRGVCAGKRRRAVDCYRSRRS